VKYHIDDSLRERPCLSCKHLIDFVNKHCKAFEVIPDEIRSGKVIHNKPYQGDKGIIYEEMSKEEKLERMKQIEERRRMRK